MDTVKILINFAEISAHTFPLAKTAQTEGEVSVFSAKRWDRRNS